LIALFLCVSYKYYRIHTSRPRFRFKSWQGMSWWKLLHHQATSHTRATGFDIYKIHHKNEYSSIMMKCSSALSHQNACSGMPLQYAARGEYLEEFGQIIPSIRYSTYLKQFSAPGTSLNCKIQHISKTILCSW